MPSVTSIFLLAALAAATPTTPTGPVGPTLATTTAATFAGGVLPANTVIELETIDIVSSETNKPGDMFRLKVAAPVMAGGTVLIAAGTPVVGQVVHAQRSTMGGKAGELILAARYLELPQGQIKLHSSLGAAGKQRTGAAVATTIAFGVFGLLVQGKSLVLPAGSPVSARVALDTTISQ